MAADPKTDSLDELPPAYQQAIRAEVRDVLRESGKKVADQQGWTKREVLQAGGFVALGLAMGGGGLLAATQPARADAAGQTGTQADPLEDLFAHTLNSGDGADVITAADAIQHANEAVSSATTIGNVCYIEVDTSVAGFTVTIPASLEKSGIELRFIDAGASAGTDSFDVTSTNWNIDGSGTATVDVSDTAFVLYSAGDRWVSHRFIQRVDAGTVATDGVVIDDTYHWASQYDGGDPDARLDNAISAASAGDTIFLESGTYDSDHTVGKRGLTLIGPGHDATGGAFLTGAQITLDGIEAAVFRMSLDTPTSGTDILLNAVKNRAVSCSSRDATRGFTVAADDALLTGLTFGDVTFQNGTSGGLLDSSVGTTSTDNGTNTVGDVG